MAKIPVIHNAPAKSVNLALLPVGLHCNADVRKAGIGSVVVLRDDWRKAKVRLVGRCIIPIRSGVFNMLLRSIYGTNFRYADFRERWAAVGQAEGWGKSGFSEDEVMVVEYEHIQEDESPAREIWKY